MRVRITVDGLAGHWDVEIPEEHSFIEWASQKRDESGNVGWDAVASFECAIRDCISEDLSAEIIPNAHPHGRAPARTVQGVVGGRNDEGRK